MNHPGPSKFSLVILRAVGLIVGCASALLMLPLASAFADPSPGAEGEFVSLIAGERAEAGLPGYSVADDLVAVARKHAADMARDGRIYHNPNLQSDVQRWDSVGENVGKGGSPGSIHQAFMDSSSHRDVILSRKFTQIGVGVIEQDGTLWVSQVFRKPSAPPPTTQPPTTTTSAAAATGATRTTRPPATPAPRPGASTSTTAGGAVATTSTTAMTVATTVAPAAPAVSTPEGDVGPDEPGAPDEVASAAPPRPNPAREVTLPIGIAGALLVVVVSGLTGQVALEVGRKPA